MAEISGYRLVRPLVIMLLWAAALAGAGWSQQVSAAAFADGEVLTIGNEFITIGVNTTRDATGRFALETTGGDPAKPEDDNKPLVYGRPRPWTSFTTVRLDGSDYVFGGQTSKRAGQSAQFGQVSQVPQRHGDAIVTSTVFGAVEVSQTLSLVKSSTTGLMDTMRVTYVVENKDTVPHQVGLRVMLDTMLGDNDGAPFRVGEAAVTEDARFQGSQLPDFWQAFDSLQAPSVTAQGVLGQESGTRPDRVVMSNWGSLADAPWETDVQPGRDFTRAGEFELDSALALYWDERPMQPGESRAYVTEYGLGGISVAPGLLALGLTAPSQVTANQTGDVTFPVVAYIESRGDAPARDVAVAIKLPRGLELVGTGAATRSLGDLSPGTSTQVLWQVASRGAVGQSFQIAVEATALNVDPNRVERVVKVGGPPRLKVELSELPGFRVIADRMVPDRVTVSAKVTNEGAADAHLVKASLQLSTGLAFAEYEKNAKFLGAMEPGESRTVQWSVTPSAAGEVKAKLTAEGSNVPPVFAETSGAVPYLAPRILVAGPDDTIKVGRFFRVNIFAQNIDQLDSVKFDLSYDPKILAVLGVSRGDLFVSPSRQTLPFGVEGIDNESGLITGLAGKAERQGTSAGTLATIHFVALTTGETPVEIKGISIFSKNQQQSIMVEPLKLRVVAP